MIRGLLVSQDGEVVQIGEITDWISMHRTFANLMPELDRLMREQYSSTLSEDQLEALIAMKKKNQENESKQEQ